MKKYWLLSVPIAVFSVISVYLFQQSKQIKKWPSPTSIITSCPTPTEQPSKITIAAVGDISLAREVNYQIQIQENSKFPFLKVAEKIKQADLAIGNLESPLIKNCPTQRSGFKFCGQAGNADGLSFAGFDSLNLANNHSRNYGSDGYQQTKEALVENNLSYFDSQTINYQTINQTKFALIGFDDTVARIDKEKLKNNILEAKEQTDLVIVNFHWGEEYQLQPNQRQLDLARFAIDNGADIIIGHHPHVVQPLKYHQGKPIFYSLGNFVFDQMWSEQTKSGAIGFITIEDNVITNSWLEKTYMSACCQPELIAN